MFLNIENLTKVYKRDKKQFEAFKNINISLDKGEFLCILGPSGCGKTTLFNIIAGLDSPSNGRVMLKGNEVKKASAERAVVFQEGALFPWLNVTQNIEFGMKEKYKDKKKRLELVTEYIKMVRLENFSDSYIHELSGGMKQRVAIARAFALESEVLLMDEPFSALDEYNRKLLQEELISLCDKTNKTVLFITHNIREAFFLGSRVLVMSESPGKIVREYSLGKDRNRNFNSKVYSNYFEDAKKILGADGNYEDIEWDKNGKGNEKNSILYNSDTPLGNCI